MTTTTLGALFQDYKENEELAVLPAAEYEVEVLACKARADEKNLDVIPTFKVASGPYVGKRVMGGVISAKGNATGRFFSTMARFGLTEEYFRANPSMEDTAKALVGRVVVASFLIEEPNKYHDDTRNKLEKIVRLISVPAGSGGVAGVPMSGAPAAAPAPGAPPVVAPPVAAPTAPAPGVPVAPVAGVPVAPAPAPAPTLAAPVVPAAVSALLTPEQLAAVAAMVVAPAPVAPPAPLAPALAPAAIPATNPGAPAPVAPVAGTITVEHEPDF